MVFLTSWFPDGTNGSYGTRTLRVHTSRRASSAEARGDRQRFPRPDSNLRQITVQPRGDDRWAVQEIGGERAEKLYDLKGDAMASALAQANVAGADLVIEGSDGRIERWEKP
jgi:hypothetical protein